jgi:hypothetical protein
MVKLTPEQSRYVLETLLARRRIRTVDVRKALLDRDREIRDLQARLATLQSLAAAQSKPRGRRRSVRRAALSGRVRALRRLQGRYMGFVRRLRPAEKARVRKVREKQGIGPAIRLASSLAKKK